MPTIIGHQKILNFFENAIKNNSLVQSYCLVGPDSVGKRTIARHICARLLNVEDKKLDTHPDFFYLARGEHEKKGTMLKDIAIEQARELKARLSTRSWLGGHKVAIIDEAEKLNEKSGNALLKTLEDSNEKTVIFLLTVDDNALLPTIKSRCQIFFAPLVSVNELTSGLLERGFQKNDVDEAVQLSWGRPGLAIKLLEDENLRKEFKIEMTRWAKILDKSFHKKIQAFDDLLEDKSDGVRTRDRLQDSIEIWMMYWREHMLENFKNQKSKTDAKKIKNLIDGLREAKQMISMNINSRLIIEQLILKNSIC